MCIYNHIYVYIIICIHICDLLWYNCTLTLHNLVDFFLQYFPCPTVFPSSRYPSSISLPSVFKFLLTSLSQYNNRREISRIEPMDQGEGGGKRKGRYWGIRLIKLCLCMYAMA